MRAIYVCQHVTISMFDPQIHTCMVYVGALSEFNSNRVAPEIKQNLMAALIVPDLDTFVLLRRPQYQQLIVVKHIVASISSTKSDTITHIEDFTE